MARDTCTFCGKDLALFKTIYAVEGALYCCKQCAIESKHEGIVANAYDEAAAWFNECAEEVNPHDIGITPPKKCYWHAYNRHEDTTSILKSTLNDRGKVVDITLVNWFNGEPIPAIVRAYVMQDTNGGDKDE